MANIKSRRDANAEATRAALIQKAGLLFAKDGFSNTSLGKIAEHARVTKGAIYHHFDSKDDIFAACYSRQASEVAKVVREVTLTDDPWIDAINQIKAYLDISMKKGGLGVSIQEAITVLGWLKWRKLDEEHTMGLLTQTIARLQAAQLLKPYTSTLLADALYGILIHAMMSLVGAEDKKTTRDELILLVQDFIFGVMTESAKEKIR